MPSLWSFTGPSFTDLPFKTSDTSIVILKALPVLQCLQCGESELEHGTMLRVEEVLAGVDQSSELEVIRFAASRSPSPTRTSSQASGRLSRTAPRATRSCKRGPRFARPRARRCAREGGCHFYVPLWLGRRQLGSPSADFQCHSSADDGSRLSRRPTPTAQTRIPLRSDAIPPRPPRLGESPEIPNTRRKGHQTRWTREQLPWHATHASKRYCPAA